MYASLLLRAPCSACRGELYITCPECAGARVVDCLLCDASGRGANGERCTTCGGDGQTRCLRCRCVGEITCPECRGRRY